jgi:hypothetical protein
MIKVKNFESHMTMISLVKHETGRQRNTCDTEMDVLELGTN